jgi:flagellar hook-length control protein FliK
VTPTVPTSTEVINAATQAQSTQDSASTVGTGMLNTLRLQLQPVEAVTQRLAAVANQSNGDSWGNLTGYSQGEGAVIDLRLESAMPGEALAGKGGNGSHASGFSDTLSALASLGNTTSESGAAVSGLSSTQSVNSTGPAESVAPKFSEQLATSQQNYQQMSDKMGQVLATRLQDQIQSGQWKMQMDVVPAHLGKISIDLNMHSGGLDATFKSDNAATRDLIVSGMPTLRHNLNQAGTTVASVWVNADARGQSGGNSTPGQGRQKPPEAEVKPEDAEDESEVSAATSGEAGWSLMA